MSRKRKHPKRRPKKIECNGCGGCCDPVTLAIGPDDLREYPQLAETMDERHREWVLNELTPTDPPPWIPEGRTPMVRMVVAGQIFELPAGFYSCANYDTETRQCLRYDDRPSVCREFPWYPGTKPDPAAALPPACEFHRSVGREPVPVELMRRKP